MPDEDWLIHSVGSELNSEDHAHTVDIALQHGLRVMVWLIMVIFTSIISKYTISKKTSIISKRTYIISKKTSIISKKTSIISKIGECEWLMIVSMSKPSLIEMIDEFQVSWGTIGNNRETLKLAEGWTMTSRMHTFDWFGIPNAWNGRCIVAWNQPLEQHPVYLCACACRQYTRSRKNIEVDNVDPFVRPFDHWRRGNHLSMSGWPNNQAEPPRFSRSRNKNT